MSQHLTSNKWGFSVEKDNPFAIFPMLQKIAKKSVGEENMIDLSRGDPGYGFSPSKRGRRFYGYLAFLDTLIDNDLDKGVMDKIEEFTHETYTAEVARELLEDLAEFIASIKKTASSFGLKWDDYAVLHEIFRYNRVTGGTYLNPQGELIVRTVLAGWYKRFISTKITPEDLILFNGASHAIGSLFKALGNEGLGFLNEDTTAVISSPVYSPYNASLFNRGVKTFNITVNPMTGEMDEETLVHLSTYRGEIGAIILIDPNNPIGYSLPEDTLEKIAHIARRFDCLVISDEVYTSFFPKKKTIVDFCPERVLRISARSKIERSTGLRFGDMFISREANEYISKKLLKDFLPEEIDFKTYLMNAKGPGGVEGEFQHTTFVPGPVQFLGISHIILGGKERESFLEEIKNNIKIFYDILKIKNRNNVYYGIFNLNEIEGCKKQDVPIEEKLTILAKKGIVFMPAYLFFSEMDRDQNDYLNMVRASFVNTGSANIEKAAIITREYLCT